MEAKQIEDLVLSILQELGEDLEIPELKNADSSTRLFGTKSPLDSMGLVNFIAETEDRISEDFGHEIILADQSAMSLRNSPFRNVSSCVAHIEKLIRSEA